MAAVVAKESPSLRSERGQAFVLTVVALVVLLGMAAVAIQHVLEEVLSTRNAIRSHLHLDRAGWRDGRLAEIQIAEATGYHQDDNQRQTARIPPSAMQPKK